MNRTTLSCKLLAAVLSGAMLLTGCGEAPVQETEAASLPDPKDAPVLTLAEPQYPEMAPLPQMDDEHFDADEYQAQSEKWYESVRLQQREPGYAQGLEGFWQSGITAFLGNDPGENKVFSPLNLYMALGMLAQVTAGSSRDQILSALGTGDLNTLQTQMSNVWNAQYRKDGATTMVLANSLWLDRDLTYRPELPDTLAETAMASVYSGVPGSPAMDEACRNWLSDQTDGLLSDSVQDVQLSPELIAAIFSTVSYHAKWQEEFDAQRTTPQVFHGKEDREVPFLRKDMEDNYFEADSFSALCLYLKNDGGRLWLLKPEKGLSPEDLLTRQETFTFLEDPYAWENNRFVILHFAMPKFDISGNLQLREPLEALGIKDVFVPGTADFSPLLDTEAPVALTSASHAVRFAADEEGITAVSYVEMQGAGAAMPPEEEVDFVLDQPFLFVLASPDGLPLFAGILSQP